MGSRILDIFWSFPCTDISPKPDWCIIPNETTNRGKIYNMNLQQQWYYIAWTNKLGIKVPKVFVADLDCM